MKRLLLILAVALALGGVLGHWLMRDAGYLLVIHGPLEIETSLGFALLALVLLLFATVVATLLLAGLWRWVSPAGLSRRLRGPVARRRLERGFRALVEARYVRAERLFKAAAYGRWPLAAWLGAARAAAADGRPQQARDYLENARQCDAGELPAELEAARLDLDAGDSAAARKRLEALADRHADHPRRIRLLVTALERQQDWEALRQLLPRLDTGDNADMARLERRLWLALLERAAGLSGDDGHRRRALEELWRAMPLHLRRDPGLVARHAGYLAQLGAGREALALVRKQLDQGWDDRLPAVLEAIEEVPAEKLLAQLESWLETRPGNGALLLTAGRVALRAGLWGKAREFFDAAVHSSHADTARAELYRLLRALGDPAGARRCLEEQAAVTIEQLPRLPLPSARDPV